MEPCPQKPVSELQDHGIREPAIRTLKVEWHNVCFTVAVRTTSRIVRAIDDAGIQGAVGASSIGVVLVDPAWIPSFIWTTAAW